MILPQPVLRLRREVEPRTFFRWRSRLALVLGIGALAAAARAASRARQAQQQAAAAAAAATVDPSVEAALLEALAGSANTEAVDFNAISGYSIPTDTDTGALNTDSSTSEPFNVDAAETNNL